MHEDRKLPRLTRPLELTLEDGWRAEVEDLSATGLRIRTLAVLPRGAELELAIPIDGAGLEAVRARVVWAEPPDAAEGKMGSAGLDLLAPPPSYLAWVARLFAEE